MKPSESSTSVLADLWPFKEAGVTVLPPLRMSAVPDISLSPGGGGDEVPAGRIPQFAEYLEKTLIKILCKIDRIQLYFHTTF